MKKIEVGDLERMPITKKMLINYIIFMYQEDAITTDEYLAMEYNMLARENRLDELFYQEFLNKAQGAVVIRFNYKKSLLRALQKGKNV